MRRDNLRKSIYQTSILIIIVSLFLVTVCCLPAGAWSRHDANYSGQWQDTGTGWWYRYTTGTDTEEWNYCGKMRFAYQWNVGQWWTFGGDAWSRLGLGNVSSSYIMDGNYHDLRNGWWFQYTLSNDTSLWNDSGKLRYSFQYSVRQWWDCGNVWGRIGVANGYSAFVGDGAYHDMRNGWWYCYTTQNDTAQWNYSGKTRFSLQYNVGQWWHTYSNNWYTLGAHSMPTAFIGDGAYHQIWSDGAKYQYVNSIDRGYWSSTGNNNDDDFRLAYSSGEWYRYYGGSTVYNGVEYKGNRNYLLTDYIYWTSSGIKSTTPTGSSYGTDLQHVFWSDSTSTSLLTYYIYTPGADLKWSGGALDVVLLNNNSNSLWMRSKGQYTNEDVVSVEMNLEGGISLSSVLTQLGYITSIYGKTIDDLNVVCHGSTDGFYFGSWVSTSNYVSTYGGQWTQLNTLMTNGGQLQLAHCLVGAAPSMLSDIASRVNVKVFANINSQWTSWYKLNNSYGYDDANVWNYNRTNVWEGAVARPAGSTEYTRPKVNFVDYDFEYQSDGSGKRGYKMLFTYYNPGYSQADMVYWWNNGNGRP